MLKRRPFAEHPTIWQGLHACYELQETEGTVAKSVYGTREGSIAVDLSLMTTDGKLRRGLNFTSNRYIDFTGDVEKSVGEVFEVGKPFSISCWVKPSSLSGLKITDGTHYFTVASFYTGSNNRKMRVYLHNPYSTQKVALESTNDVFSVGTWAHRIYVYGGGNIYTDWTFYVDGLAVPWSDAGSVAGLTSIAKLDKMFRIGYSDTTYNAPGVKEQLCIWNRAITPSEAKWLAEGHVSDQSHASVLLSLPYFNGDRRLNEGLVAHWAMDDDAASTVVTEKITGITSTLTGGSNTEDLAIAGLQGGALDFDGTNYIDCPIFPSIENLDCLSPSSGFMVFKRTQGTSLYWSLFNTRDSGADTGVQFLINIDGTPYIIFRSSTGGYIRCKTTVVTPLNTYALIGYTYDGSGSSTGLTAWLNTTPYTDRASSGTMPDSVASALTIGYDNRTPAAFKTLVGEMQQLSIWNRELSAGDVVRLYDNGRILPC